MVIESRLLGSGKLFSVVGVWGAMGRVMSNAFGEGSKNKVNKD